ncbi:MAG TPA: hypothetical protein VIK61_08235 [Acidimicrobiia bacterium]
MIGTRITVAVCIVGLLGACGSSSKPKPKPKPKANATTTTLAASVSRVDVWGDSLTVQSRDALRVEGRAHGLAVTVNAYVGLAPCDLAPFVRGSLARPPGAVVLAFTGNNITPCMQRAGKPLTGAPYYAEYASVVGQLVAAATARRIPVIVVGPPTFPPSENHPDRVALNVLYRWLVAAHPGARYVALGPALSPHGFSRTVACLAGETAALGCRSGVITVRSGNGIHLDEPRPVACPDGSGGCMYSAGGHRYADAILAALATIASLSYRSADPTVGVPIAANQGG